MSKGKIAKIRAERVEEISAIQRVLKDHIKDSAVRTTVAHQCAAAAKAAREAFFNKLLEKGDNDNGE